MKNVKYYLVKRCSAEAFLREEFILRIDEENRIAHLLGEDDYYGFFFPDDKSESMDVKKAINKLHWNNTVDFNDDLAVTLHDYEKAIDVINDPRDDFEIVEVYEA